MHPSRQRPIDKREVLERVLPRRPFTIARPAEPNGDAAPGRGASAPRPSSAARGEPRSRAARELLARLPAGMLDETAARFAHVLDPIARDWGRPAALAATLDALMFDERGARGGFPIRVVCELAELRAYHDRWVGPVSSLGR